jgi:hypothetical protein
MKIKIFYVSNMRSHEKKQLGKLQLKIVFFFHQKNKYNLHMNHTKTDLNSILTHIFIIGRTAFFSVITIILYKISLRKWMIFDSYNHPWPHTILTMKSSHYFLGHSKKKWTLSWKNLNWNLVRFWRILQLQKEKKNRKGWLRVEKLFWGLPIHTFLCTLDHLFCHLIARKNSVFYIDDNWIDLT